MADRQITWTAADGTQIVLTDTNAGYTVLGEGTRGLRSVEYEVSSQRYAGIDGESVQSIRAIGNKPTLGLLLAADSDDDFRTRARRLRHKMRPKAGLGVLTVSRDGDQRDLACYCVGGFEGDESPGTSLAGRWWKLALKFYAPGAWWEGPEQSVIARLEAESLTEFFPLPPVALAGSTVAGQFTVDLSESDAPSYPLWTITGPGADLVLTNETTGRFIQVNTTLGAGDVMVIDTRPSRQSVRLADGTNLMGSLDSDPALWPLIEDVNVVTAALTGATADSSITGTFRPRYAGI